MGSAMENTETGVNFPGVALLQHGIICQQFTDMCSRISLKICGTMTLHWSGRVSSNRQ